MGFRRPLLVATLIVAAVALTGFGVSVNEQNQAVSLVNQSRGGSSQLSQDDWLTQRATAHAERLRDDWVRAGCPSDAGRYLRHVSDLAGHYQPRQVHRNWTKVGENVGVIGIGRAGTGLAIQKLHEAYMASPGHRANIVDRRYTRIGLGVATGPTQGQLAAGACAGVPADSMLWNAQAFVAAPVK